MQGLLPLPSTDAEQKTLKMGLERRNRFSTTLDTIKKSEKQTMKMSKDSCLCAKTEFIVVPGGRVCVPIRATLGRRSANFAVHPN
uniref:Uncharacterized protein n=1 Tax=Romanomermis culicivorax TaxID=13658 RepID=A0A915KU31_ROMCU